MGTQEQLSISELCRLAEYHGTDKAGWYTPFYDLIFRDRRDKIYKVLEIGIGTASAMSHVPGYKPGASLRMWRDYFPNAEIHGMDVDLDAVAMAQDYRIITWQADQSDELSLQNVFPSLSLGGKFDLIIDDGSHKTEDQLLTFKVLSRLLDPRGLYIIEDVGLLLLEIEHTEIHHRREGFAGHAILIRSPCRLVARARRLHARAPGDFRQGRSRGMGFRNQRQTSSREEINGKDENQDRITWQKGQFQGQARSFAPRSGCSYRPETRPSENLFGVAQQESVRPPHGRFGQGLDGDGEEIMPTLAQFAQAVQSAPAGTGATTILAASGNAAVYRDIVSITITTPNAAAATLTISDGNKTVAIFNYPDAALAPGAPFVITFDTPLAQSLPNKAWTITPSVNASGFNVTTQYVER